MKENMLDENSEILPKNCIQPDDPLMKPFTSGWTREVVMRVVTKNKTPKCDIYYFSPSGKKIRSLTEMKANLIDGLTPECFSFKRERLGVSPNFETVRKARIRGKVDEKLNKKAKSVRSLEHKVENSVGENDSTCKESGKKRSRSDERTNLKTETGVNEKEEASNSDEKDQDKENRSKRKRKSEEKEIREDESLKKTKKKTEIPSKEKPNIRSKSVRKRTILKTVGSVLQAKQAKVGAGKKILKKVVRKAVARSPKRKLVKGKTVKETELKNKSLKKKSKVITKSGKKPVKNNKLKGKVETAKDETSTSESDQKSVARDLKSIVQKNIVKYREMREQQKLGIIKSSARPQKRKLFVGNATRARSEPISKNRQFYLKPLEKGWRRELVYRTNSARAGQQADVYYFHPTGKKLRSSREIAENLTHGLSIECFTFKKEPIGCGEPSEVIRKARSHQKPQPVK